jgi:hypothetical protein
VIIAAQQRLRTRVLTLLAWALCILSVTLALASVALASFNGENLLELVANHHAIGILNALVLPLIGALIVVGDRRHLLAWLLILAGAFLAVYNLGAVAWGGDPIQTRQAAVRRRRESSCPEPPAPF